MEKTVDLRQIQEATRQLRERGERVSRRSVQAIAVGSITTVNDFLGFRSVFVSLNTNDSKIQMS